MALLPALSDRVKARGESTFTDGGIPEVQGGMSGPTAVSTAGSNGEVWVEEK